LTGQKEDLTAEIIRTNLVLIKWRTILVLID